MKKVNLTHAGIAVAIAGSLFAFVACSSDDGDVLPQPNQNCEDESNQSEECVSWRVERDLNKVPGEVPPAPTVPEEIPVLEVPTEAAKVE